MLSKDHKTLPTAEVYSCLKAEKIVYAISEKNQLFGIYRGCSPAGFRGGVHDRLVGRLEWTFHQLSARCCRRALFVGRFVRSNWLAPAGVRAGHGPVGFFRGAAVDLWALARGAGVYGLWV